MNNNFAEKLDVYDKLIMAIKSALNRFKDVPEGPSSDADKDTPSAGGHFYILGSNLENLSQLNKELEIIYNRLSEIL
jgi:hypothetical protein